MTGAAGRGAADTGAADTGAAGRGAPATSPIAVLVGPPGSGKTTVARSLAHRLGVTARDTDADVEQVAGKPISEIFFDDGEPAFRALERAAVAAALTEHDGIVALGGGAVLDPETERALARYAAGGGTVVFLDVALAQAAPRVGFNTARPLLLGNPRAQWQALMEARRPVYGRVATLRVETGDLRPRQVAAKIAEALGHGADDGDGPEGADRARTPPARGSTTVSDTAGQQPTTITVEGDQPYDVVIGHHLLGELPRLLGDGVRRVLVIHPGALTASAEAMREDLVAQGYEAFLAEVPEAEAAKTAQVAGFLWRVLGQADFTRSDAVVGLGGGSTTDLAGFVAATWLRGIKVVQVPTTVLGMVDAAVGGKTGINTAEGKNLVGAFYPPAGVLCDLDALDSLPVHDRTAGLAEVIKAGFVDDERILQIVEADPVGLTAPSLTEASRAALRELIERAVAYKARVVGQDLREAGPREFLNYGHTFGHALEHVERFSWRHGAAVSVGMVYAAELARLAGRLDDAVVDRHRAVLTSVGLPVSYRGDRWEQLLAAMQRDKKTRGNRLRFVVLDAIGRPSRLEGPDPGLLAAAYAEVSREAPTEAPVHL